MNATIMDVVRDPKGEGKEGNSIVKCDSPTLPPEGFSDSHAPFYYVGITMNGREVTMTNKTFTYYI